MSRFQYQQLAEPVLTPATPSKNESVFHFPWSEPVRQKIAPALAIALMTSGLIAPVLDPNTQVTQNFESRWHYPWSEPVRIKPALPVQEHLFHALNPVQSFAPPCSWFAPLSDPVRIPLRTAWFSFYTTDTAPFPVSRYETWFAPLSEPSVKYKLRTAEYAPFTTDTAAIPVTKYETWYAPLSEPVRFKPRDAWFTFFAPDSAAFPTSRYDPWFDWLSEPVRTLPRAAWFNFYTTDTTPLVVRNLDPWFAPLSEPVRIKPRLLEGLQAFFTFGFPQYGFFLATRESGDVAVLGLDDYTKVPEIYANVSVLEIQAIHARANVSITVI